jgi:hypothetical protein
MTYAAGHRSIDAQFQPAQELNPGKIIAQQNAA